MSFFQRLLSECECVSKSSASVIMTSPRVCLLGCDCVRVFVCVGITHVRRRWRQSLEVVSSLSARCSLSSFCAATDDTVSGVDGICFYAHRRMSLTCTDCRQTERSTYADRLRVKATLSVCSDEFSVQTCTDSSVTHSAFLLSNAPACGLMV